MVAVRVGSIRNGSDSGPGPIVLGPDLLKLAQIRHGTGSGYRDPVHRTGSWAGSNR